MNGKVIAVDSRRCRGTIRLEDGTEMTFGPGDVSFANDELKNRGSSSVLDGRWVALNDRVVYRRNAGSSAPFLIVASGKALDIAADRERKDLRARETK